MASWSTCHLGLWLGWQILLNLVKYSRMENVIISGLQTSHRSYTRTTADQTEHAPNENIALEENGFAMFNNQLDVPMTKGDVSVCHTLSRRLNCSTQHPAPSTQHQTPNTQQGDIVVRFVGKRSKTVETRNARQSSSPWAKT